MAESSKPDLVNFVENLSIGVSDSNGDSENSQRNEFAANPFWNAVDNTNDLVACCDEVFSNGAGGADEDTGDAGHIGVQRSYPSTSMNRNSTNNVNGVAIGFCNTSMNDDYYSMSKPKRGYCIIFNHMNFDKHTRMTNRNGTNKDRDDIADLFNKLGFLVRSYDDLTVCDVLQTIDHYSMQEDHSKFDCIALFVLTHGEENTFFARDGDYKCDRLFTAFEAEKCPSLAGKPKLFFIQACRGDKLDRGINMYVSTDEPPFSHKLPNTADILTMWSTVPGYYSWRNTTNGSWFVQALCHVLEKNVTTLDLVSMHALINRHMIFNYQSNVPSDLSMHGMKQVSSLVTTTTRLVHFYPPRKGSVGSRPQSASSADVSSA